MMKPRRLGEHGPGQAANGQRARQAFIRKFIAEFGQGMDERQEEIKQTIERLRLPFAIRKDLELWLSRFSGIPGAAAVEGIHQVPIWVGPASLNTYPDGTPTENRYTIIYDRGSLADGGKIEVEAATLSAAKKGASAAVVDLWKQLEWPTNPQPYKNAERDAEYLFDWWCKRIPYNRIGEADPHRPDSPRAIENAVRHVRELLGFQDNRPPR